MWSSVTIHNRCSRHSDITVAPAQRNRSCKMGFKDETVPEYRVTNGARFEITEEMKRNFWRDGFIIVRNLLSKEEITKFRSSLESGDSAVMAQSYKQNDGEGRDLTLALWNHPGEDLSGIINRCEKVVDTCEALIGGEVYHYHSKIVMKAPGTGGAFQWHQDYGYWYRNGVLFPDLVSVQIAIDDMDTENGCLQIIRGSHKMGRIEHGRKGQQVEVDLDRITEAEKLLQRMTVPLQAGDGLFFHCNLLHRSDANESARRRWALTACYNRADNNPYKDHHHARYTPLKKVPDSAIMDCKNLDNIEGKWFINPNKSHPEYLPDERK